MSEQPPTVAPASCSPVSTVSSDDGSPPQHSPSPCSPGPQEQHPSPHAPPSSRPPHPSTRTRLLPSDPQRWRAQPRLALTAGVYFSNEWPRDGYAWDSRRFFDAMLFVDSTSESHLRPGGVWPQRAIQSAPSNLTLEESTPRDGPTGWYPAPSFGSFGFVDPEYRTALSRESPTGRGQSVVVSRAPGRHYGMTNGGIEQIIDAAPYRGKWLRLKAMCREQVVGGDSRASLWISFTPKVVEDMQIRLSGVQTISGRTWRSYELNVQVTENAATISYGLSLAGDGRAWIDDVSVEVLPKPPL